MKKVILIDVAGYTGMVCLLVAYALTSSGNISSSGYLYQVLSLFGSIGIMINAYAKKAMPPFILNVIWAILAVYFLLVR